MSSPAEPTVALRTGWGVVGKATDWIPLWPRIFEGPGVVGPFSRFLTPLTPQEEPIDVHQCL